MDALESLSEELIRDLEQRLATAVTNCLTEQSNVTTTAPQRKPVVDALILDITKQLRVPIDQRVQQEAEVLRQTSARQEAELVELRQAAQAQAQRQLELERLRTAASERDALRNKCEQLAAAAERGQALQEKVASQADDLRSLRAELAAALQRAARTSTVTSEQVADGSEQLAKNVVAKVREAKLAAEGTDVGGKDVEWSATAWMRRDGTVIDAVAEALLAPLQRVAAATDATVAAGGAAALPGEMQQQYVSGLAEQLGPPEEGATVLAGWLESAGVVHKLAAKLDKAARLLRAEVEQRAESDRAAATAPGGDSKFEMAFGGLETFYGGLEKYVGLPDVPVEKALEGEHTKRCDSFRDFEATNLGITTKSIWEYWFVADPSQEKVKELARHPRAPMTSGAWPREAKNDTLSGVREPLSADTGPLQYEREERNRELLKLNADQLMRTELVAARLYTGPLFVKYNAVLRGKNDAPDSFMGSKFLKLCGDDDTKSEPNDYRTTIHLINSAIIKLGKLTPPQTVYRGLSRAVLPERFRQGHDGAKGGVELGFMSTTTDRNVALSYARRDTTSARMVFKIPMGLVDRGADLAWLSRAEYQGEAEILFPPLSTIEWRDQYIEADVLILEMRLSVNLTSRTIEKLIANRRETVRQMCENMTAELRIELAHDSKLDMPRWAGLQEAVDELLQPFNLPPSVPRPRVAVLAEPLLVQMLAPWLDYPPDWYTDDEQLKRAIDAVVASKRTVSGAPAGLKKLVRHMEGKSGNPAGLFDTAPIGNNEAGALAILLISLKEVLREAARSEEGRAALSSGGRGKVQFGSGGALESATAPGGASGRLPNKGLRSLLHLVRSKELNMLGREFDVEAALALESAIDTLPDACLCGRRNDQAFAQNIADCAELTNADAVLIAASMRTLGAKLSAAVFDISGRRGEKLSSIGLEKLAKALGDKDAPAFEMMRKGCAAGGKNFVLPLRALRELGTSRGVVALTGKGLDDSAIPFLSELLSSAFSAPYEGEPFSEPTLDLSWNHLSGGGLGSLFTSLCQPAGIVSWGLQTINLMGNRLEDDGVLALAAFLSGGYAPELSSLLLYNNGITDRGFKALVLALRAHSPQRHRLALGLGGNDIECALPEEDAPELARGLRRVSQLHLSGCQLGNRPCLLAALLERLHADRADGASTLLVDLSANLISKALAKELGQRIPGASLDRHRGELRAGPILTVLRYNPGDLSLRDEALCSQPKFKRQLTFDPERLAHALASQHLPGPSAPRSGGHTPRSEGHTPSEQAEGFRNSLTVVGTINIDLVAKTKVQPGLGAPVELGSSFDQIFGGKGANQAIAASRLRRSDDPSNIFIVAKIGPDANGRDAKANLQANHVRTEHVSTTPDLLTGVALISVGTGEDGAPHKGDASILVVPSANGMLRARDVMRAQNPCFDQSCVVLCQNEMPDSYDATFEGLRMGWRNGCVCIFHAAPSLPFSQKEKDGKQFFRHCDAVCIGCDDLLQMFDREKPEGYATPASAATAGGRPDYISADSEADLRALLREMKLAPEWHHDGGYSGTDGEGEGDEDRDERMRLEWRGKYVIVHGKSVGMNGCTLVELADDGEALAYTVFEAPAEFASLKPVDVTGDIDAFLGAVARLLTEGVRLPYALPRGVHVAALATQRDGAQDSFPSLHLEELPTRVLHWPVDQMPESRTR